MARGFRRRNEPCIFFKSQNCSWQLATNNECFPENTRELRCQNHLHAKMRDVKADRTSLQRGFFPKVEEGAKMLRQQSRREFIPPPERKNKWGMTRHPRRP